MNEHTAIAIKIDATRRSADPGNGSCPVCATPDALRGRRCASCGVRFACPKCKIRFDYEVTRTAQPCPNCQTPHEVPASRLVTRPAPPIRPLAAALEDWLTANGTTTLTVRRGSYDLARAHAEAGDWPEAAVLLDRAASAPGDDPPERDLTLWRASAMLATGEVVAAARTILAASVPQSWDEPAEQRIRATLEVLTAEDATGLARWLGLDANDDQEEDAARLHVLSAALWLIAGDHAKVAEELATAADEDQLTASACWRAVARAAPIAELLGAAEPQAGPGNAAALTLAARLAFALGNLAEADALVAFVLDNALTGEGYPEAEAYLLRGRRRDRPLADRAADLLEAARRMSWRDSRSDLLRSAEVAEEATDLDPLLLEAYWVRADSLRTAAYQPGKQPDLDLLRAALKCWDTGRALGPPSEAWPFNLEALLCLELGQLADPAAAGHGRRALLAASNFALASPGSPYAWSVVGCAAQRLCMWSTAIYASDRALQLAEGSDDQLRAYSTAVDVFFQIDPDRAADLLSQLEQGQDEDYVGYLRAVEAVRAGRFSDAVPVFTAALAKDPADVSIRYWLARALMGSRDPGATEFLADSTRAAGLGRGTVNAALVRAWLLLWQGDPRTARQVVADLLDRSGGMIFDPSCSTDLLPMQAAIVAGEFAAARRVADKVIPAAPYGVLIDLEGELSWVASLVSERGDSAGIECVTGIQGALAAAKELAPGRGEQNLAVVLAEVEAAICDRSVPPADRAGASAVHALISSQAREPRSDPATWMLPMAIELGAELIPADAAETWPQWSLFTQLIPGVREHLRASTGLEAPGIRVRSADGLGPRQYRLLLDEHAVLTAVADPAGADQADADSADDAEHAWRQVANAVRNLISARPSLLCTPEALLTLVNEWNAGTPEQRRLASQLTADRVACTELWARLYALAAAHGRIPQPGHVLEKLAEDVLTVGSQVGHAAGDIAEAAQ